MTSVIAGPLHYILNGDGVEELYDIERDPDELADLADTPAFSQELERLRAANVSSRSAASDAGGDRDR
jgi:hypothetical protein